MPFRHISRQKLRRALLPAALLAAGALLLAGFLWMNYHGVTARWFSYHLHGDTTDRGVNPAVPASPDSGAPSAAADTGTQPASGDEASAADAAGEDTPVPTGEIPANLLVITEERRGYEDGEMTLSIPAIGLSCTVSDGVDNDDLRRGVGLYDYAQLPGEGLRNVSIAGHRDVHGAEFYYIDRVRAGDLFQLTFRGTIYTYAYTDAKIHEADDWSPIYTAEDNRLTLTSCFPLGSSAQRLIITAALIDMKPVD